MQLREAGVLTDGVEEKLTAEIKSIVDEATDYAEAQADPDPSTATRYVYVEDVD
jgi:TPP-dependent pyruvate/acetoin dehydrogenase alpha subunit